MSKFCTNCGANLADDDLFCSNCGTKQEIAKTPIENKPLENEKIKPDAETVESAVAVPTRNNAKHCKKPLVLAIACVVVICIIVALAIVFSGGNKGLVAVDELEQQLNAAYIKVWEGHDIGFDGVVEFKTETVNEETHDQIFSCFVMPSEDGVTGLRVMGLVKDGQVVQIQSIYFGSEDAFNQLDADAQASFLALSLFPISIFKEDIDTIQEFGHFLRNMDVLKDGTSGPDNMRTVDGDIEYTYMGGTGKGFILSSFTIRYLPAFSTGFFDDDNSTQGATGGNPSSEQYTLYDTKIDEYRQALTMGLDDFEKQYDGGFDCSSINASLVRDCYNYGGTINYAIYDIDENGTDELIFANSEYIIDIYTLHSGKLIKLFENCDFGYRSRVHILSTGLLLSEGASGAFSASCEMYRIDETTGMLTDPIGAYYFDSNGKNSQMSEYTYTSEDKYYDMINKWLLDSLYNVFEWKSIVAISKPSYQETGVLFGQLDCSKAWSSEYDYGGYPYTLHFVFETTGDCYFALSAGEVFSKGVGTYTTDEQNMLYLTLTIDGNTEEYIYKFNKDDNSITVVSEEGIVGAKGQTHILNEDPFNDAAKVKKWATIVDDGLGGWG